MIEFWNEEAAYLEWQRAPLHDGFVAQMDKAAVVPQYPMIHRADCAGLKGAANYTTGSYFKVCSTDMGELHAWAHRRYGRALTPCGRCM